MRTRTSFMCTEIIYLPAARGRSLQRPWNNWVHTIQREEWRPKDDGPRSRGISARYWLGNSICNCLDSFPPRFPGEGVQCRSLLRKNTLMLCVGREAGCSYAVSSFFSQNLSCPPPFSSVSFHNCNLSVAPSPLVIVLSAVRASERQRVLFCMLICARIVICFYCHLEKTWF